jgi:uncharacterized membrane protein YphA (DoxX/SURF4 family)
MNKIHPWLILVIRILLGIIFLYASYDKIMDPGKFARSIANYHIVPFGLENSIAIILPWLELFIGVGLIAGIMVDGAAGITGSLLVIFILLILLAILRGFNIECGCGLKEGEMVGWTKILENIVFLFASWMVFSRQKNLFEFFPKSPLSE